MRVLLINSLYHPFRGGGAEASVRELAAALTSDGATVAVATLAPGPSDTSPPTSSSHDTVRIYRWETPVARQFMADSKTESASKRVQWHVLESLRFGARRFIRDVLREFQPDVVHSNNLAGFGSLVFDELAKLPWVHTLRDYYLMCPRTTRYRNGTRCSTQCFSCNALTALRRHASSAPDVLVGVSRFVLDAHQGAGIWQNTPSLVIANSPEVGVLRSRRIGRIKTLGFLGSVDERKGVGVLLKAIRLVRAQKIELVVAGSVAPRFAEEFMTLSVNLPVRHLGHVPVEDFLELVDLVVIPSQWDEPFGRVAAEATRVGLPVLASKRGGLPEATFHGERVELINSVADPQSWASAIDRAVVRWSDFTIPTVSPVASNQPARSYLEAYGLAVRGRSGQ